MAGQVRLPALHDVSTLHAFHAASVATFAARTSRAAIAATILTVAATLAPRILQNAGYERGC